MKPSEEIAQEIELGLQDEDAEDPELAQMLRETNKEFESFEVEAKKIFDDLVLNQPKEVLFFVGSYLRMWEFKALNESSNENQPN